MQEVVKSSVGSGNTLKLLDNGLLRVRYKFNVRGWGVASKNITSKEIRDKKS